MIIVAGSLLVEPAAREGYLRDCVSAVTQARAAPGCLDFALSADLVEAGRINVFERWDTEQNLQNFRGSGPDDSQQGLLLEIRVSEYRVD